MVVVIAQVTEYLKVLNAYHLSCFKACKRKRRWQYLWQWRDGCGVSIIEGLPVLNLWAFVWHREQPRCGSMGRAVGSIKILPLSTCSVYFTLPQSLDHAVMEHDQLRDGNIWLTYWWCVFQDVVIEVKNWLLPPCMKYMHALLIRFEIKIDPHLGGVGHPNLAISDA